MGTITSDHRQLVVEFAEALVADPSYAVRIAWNAHALQGSESAVEHLRAEREREARREYKEREKEREKARKRPAT